MHPKLTWEGVNKPGSCPLRKVKPIGPIKGCEDICWAFKECVDYSRGEKSFEEYKLKEIERLRNLGRESPVEDMRQKPNPLTL